MEERADPVDTPTGQLMQQQSWPVDIQVALSNIYGDWFGLTGSGADVALNASAVATVTQLTDGTHFLGYAIGCTSTAVMKLDELSGEFEGIEDQQDGERLSVLLDHQLGIITHLASYVREQAVHAAGGQERVLFEVRQLCKHFDQFALLCKNDLGREAGWAIYPEWTETSAEAAAQFARQHGISAHHVVERPHAPAKASEPWKPDRDQARQVCQKIAKSASNVLGSYEVLIKGTHPFVPYSVWVKQLQRDVQVVEDAIRGGGTYAGPLAWTKGSELHGMAAAAQLQFLANSVHHRDTREDESARAHFMRFESFVMATLRSFDIVGRLLVAPKSADASSADRSWVTGKLPQFSLPGRPGAATSGPARRDPRASAYPSGTSRGSSARSKAAPAARTDQKPPPRSMLVQQPVTVAVATPATWTHGTDRLVSASDDQEDYLSADALRKLQAGQMAWWGVEGTERVLRVHVRPLGPPRALEKKCDFNGTLQLIMSTKNVGRFVVSGVPRNLRASFEAALRRLPGWSGLKVKFTK